ncbi:MAG: hypothetical protein Ta2F_09380 [Termitinemataceae bacterium]|nr:MAG: hypothetical protein Ta2F_09380 [Termitinemataceae bacterium]
MGIKPYGTNKIVASTFDTENEWFFYDDAFSGVNCLEQGMANTWLHENFAAVYKGDIIGYFEGSWSRPVDIITGFRTINFTQKYSRVFVLALFKYFEYLFENRGCMALNWIVTHQNEHAMKQYERFVENYCGHKVGVRGSKWKKENIKMNKLFLRILFLFTLVIIFISCEKIQIQEKVEIPFKLENNRMILDATVNGKTGRFLFDTGATISVIDVNTKNLRYHGYVKWFINDKPKKIKIYKLSEIYFGDIELKTHNQIVKYGPNSEIIKSEGYDGIIGMRTFEGYWMELSFSKNKIILHKEKPDYFTNYSIAKVENKYNDPFYIPVNIDDTDYYFMLDTGVGSAFRFPKGIVNTEKQNEIIDVLSIQEEKQHNVYKTKTIKVLGVEFNDSFVVTNSYLAARRRSISSNDLGLLGLTFLKHYDLLFDLRQTRRGKTTGLYYKSSSDVNDYGFFRPMKEVPKFVVLNFDFTTEGIVILSVIKDSIAYNKFSIKPGTIITKVNGKPIKEFSLPELQDPSFYLTIDNYTILENGLEKTIPAPLD